MSLFKKIGHSVSSAFKKAPSAISGLFKKGGAIAQGVSKGLGSVSKVLGDVGKVGGQILNNPLVQAGVLGLAPELAPALIAGKALASGVSQASKVASLGSNLTDTSSYKGSNLENLKDAKRRFDELKGEASNLQFS